MDFGISKDASATSPTRPQKICRARGPARTLLSSARSTAGLKDHLVAPIRFRDGAFPAALLRRRVRVLGAVQARQHPQRNGYGIDPDMDTPSSLMAIRSLGGRAMLRFARPKVPTVPTTPHWCLAREAAADGRIALASATCEWGCRPSARSPPAGAAFRLPSACRALADRGRPGRRC